MSRLARRCVHCSSLFLCVCVPAPTMLVCLCLAHFSLCYITSPCTTPALPRPPPLNPPLFVTWVHSSLGASLLGFALLLFLYLPTLSSLTNKGQVGIRVGTHLNKMEPSKLQIYAPSAVCNCRYPEVCPSLLICVQFIKGAYLELSLAKEDFSNTLAKVALLKQRFPWAGKLEYIWLKVWLLSAFHFFCFVKQSLQSLSRQSLSFRGIHWPY